MDNGGTFVRGRLTNTANSWFLRKSISESGINGSNAHTRLSFAEKEFVTSIASEL